MRISDWSSDVCSSDLPHSLGVRKEKSVCDLIADFRQFRGREIAGQFIRRDAIQRRHVQTFQNIGEGHLLRALAHFNFHAIILHKQIDLLDANRRTWRDGRSEEHTSDLQTLMRNSYAVFCSTKKTSSIMHLQTNTTK